MRLWHYNLIPILPRQQLLGQHRECCALRCLGWGKKHKTVDYVFKYNYIKLFSYHMKVVDEMIKRGYKIKIDWHDYCYRGKKLGTVSQYDLPNRNIFDGHAYYPEHDEKYLQECMNNLKNKGVIL